MPQTNAWLAVSLLCWFRVLRTRFIGHTRVPHYLYHIGTLGRFYLFIFFFLLIPSGLCLQWRSVFTLFDSRIDFAAQFNLNSHAYFAVHIISTNSLMLLRSQHKQSFWRKAAASGTSRTPSLTLFHPQGNTRDKKKKKKDLSRKYVHQPKQCRGQTMVRPRTGPTAPKAPLPPQTKCSCKSRTSPPPTYAS